LGEWAYKNVGKKIFMTAPDYAAGKESVEGFKATFVKAGGSVVGEVYPPFGKTSDYAPFLTQIQQAKPEAVYAFYSGTEAVSFVKQYEQFGLKKDIPLVAAGFLIEQDTLPAQGTSALGIRSTLHYSDALDTPENKKFVSEFTTKYKRPVSTFALQGFDTARFIVEGLKVVNGDTTNKDNLIKALEGVKFTSPRGPLEIDPANHGLTQNIYLREVVAGPDGKPINKVIATFEKIQDINTLLKN
jgi:branched-chain amino acid transport system substrate-binding protein